MRISEAILQASTETLKAREAAIIHWFEHSRDPHQSEAHERRRTLYEIMVELKRRAREEVKP